MTVQSETWARLRAIPVPVQGALYMTGAAFGFAVMNAIIRELSQALHPFEIAFFRNLFSLLFMLPLLFRGGGLALRTERLGAHLLRALIGLGGMLAWFSALASLPLTEAVALNFTVPLFATIGAALFLGEVVGIRRWSATAVGFLGVLIILRPGFTEITPVMSLPILASLFMASAMLMVKSLSRTETAGTVVLYMVLIATPLSLIPALFVWRWPDTTGLLLLLLLGGIATLAHLAFSRACARADASAVIPFDYLRLPFVGVIGYLVFGELSDLWTWVGAGVIAGAAIYIARREARLARADAARTAVAITPDVRH